GLEYYDLGGILDERVPQGLLGLAGLRGLSCSVAKSAFKSALVVLPRLPQLEVLSLGFGCDLDAAQLAAVRAALPGVYIRVAHYDPVEKNDPDELPRLDRQMSNHLSRNEFAEAASLGDRLFALIDLDRPEISAGWLENAMRNRVWALSMLAHEETDPSRRRDA